MTSSENENLIYRQRLMRLRCITQAVLPLSQRVFGHPVQL